MNSLIDKIRAVSHSEANITIREICGIVDYFASEDEKRDFISANEISLSTVCEDRVAYGDWQTPQSLADKVCEKHVQRFDQPDIAIEPTCGLGAFVFSALEKFTGLSEIHALEINPQYVAGLKLKILLNALSADKKKYPDIYIYNADFFKFDFSPVVERALAKDWNLAIIGNPPWVTNSSQGRNESDNVPLKHNRFKLRGIDAITGKSNFDISESITLGLLQLSQKNKGGISFLLKNSVIRELVSKQKSNPVHIGEFEQLAIDASSEFNVSVDASCFSARFDCVPGMRCEIKDFYSGSDIREYGWVCNSFVSDTALYSKFLKFDNKSSFIWRSGIKHDCSSVLELSPDDGKYINGLGETVKIEDDLIFPFLKSSDINNYPAKQFRKFVIVPQHRIGDDTSSLKYSHPLAYNYLHTHEDFFSRRKSIIYKGKDTFSIFGIGDYSFKPYKIVVSSLYKNLRFILVNESQGKPVMVDDTCYQLAFDTLDEAKAVYEALQSDEIQKLLRALSFTDSKRVITKQLLMRLDIELYCKENGIDLKPLPMHKEKSACGQLSLFD